MCGIYICISRHGFRPLNSDLRSLLQQRGPDSFVEEYIQIPMHNAGDEKVFISIASSVLALRGNDVVPQPIFHEQSKTFLCWNGEAWKLSNHTSGAQGEITGNDAAAIFQLLVPNNPPQGAAVAHHQICKSFEAVTGPFAMAFFDSRFQKLYFGRDFLGRRSMVVGGASNGDYIISSIPNADPDLDWYELNADGIYWISLQLRLNGTDFVVNRVNYVTPNSSMANSRDVTITSPFPTLNRTLPQQEQKRLSWNSKAVRTLERLLLTALRLRICNVRPRHRDISLSSEPDVAILFSGGVDCSILARLSHELLPPDEPIDLLNVAFENPRIHADKSASPHELCPDRITARRSHEELQKTCPKRPFRLVTINVPYSETLSHRPTIMSLMYPHNTEMDLSIATALYFASRGIGTSSSSERNRTIAAFQELGSSNICNIPTPPNSTTPCPTSAQSAPQSSSHSSQSYTTPARVLLSGLGADELFGGYHRHAIVFQQRGYSGILDELELDFNRLGKRNLGRDDRVISHWSKEARYPYLDEDLVAWALDAPVWEKCGFGTARSGSNVDGEEGLGELEDGKFVLRLLAEKLGLKGVAREKKRAIQFGSRTAKMKSGRVKGTTRLDET